jgi:hypothetical protein
MTMDLDSTVCEVHGYHKQGAAYGYTSATPVDAHVIPRGCAQVIPQGVALG